MLCNEKVWCISFQLLMLCIRWSVTLNSILVEYYSAHCDMFCSYIADPRLSKHLRTHPCSAVKTDFVNCMNTWNAVLRNIAM